MVNCPVLILWGENDVALAKELAHCEPWVPNLTIKYIPNCSHWVQLDAPEEVNENLTKFLA